MENQIAMGNYYGEAAPSKGDSKAARVICPLIMTVLAIFGIITVPTTLAIMIWAAL